VSEWCLTPIQQFFSYIMAIQYVVSLGFFNIHSSHAFQ